MNFTNKHEIKYPLWWVAVRGALITFVVVVCTLAMRRDVFDMFGDREDEA